MPIFPIEYTSKETVHQRHVIEIEADTIEEAIAAVEEYEFDNSNATELGKSLFSESLVDDVKLYAPELSPFGLPGCPAPEGAGIKLRFQANGIIFATDGAETELPGSMTVEIDGAAPAETHRDLVIEAITDRTGWLVESLEIEELSSEEPLLTES